MAVLGTVIAITTATGTLLAPTGGVNQVVTVRNDGAGTLWIGGVNVGTQTTGYALTPGVSVALQLWSDETLYAQANTGTINTSLIVTHR